MLLEVQDLRVSYDAGITAVDGVGLRLDPGEALAVVGESGSGKSTLVRALLGLPEPARITGGRILFEGRDLRSLTAREQRRLRGRRIGFVPQDTGSSLNPVRRVGSTIAEAVRVRCGVSRGEARRRAVAALESVEVPQPAALARCYPHELSGGLRQRVLLAAAMALRPRLLLADEPTSSLDAAVQGGILRLLRRLRDEGLAVLLVTHQLTLAGHIGGRVAVYYAGRIVEEGPAPEVFAAPHHPYTRALVRALPERGRPGERFEVGEGLAPPLWHRPPGCAFHPRCPLAGSRCREVVPPLEPRGEGRLAACLREDGLEDGGEARV